MSYGLKVEIWGEYALFTRPELKSERMSYEIITPSAARGLIESIAWHPAIKIIIDRIYLLAPYGTEPDVGYEDNPIRFVNIRRNEIGEKASAQKIVRMMTGGKEDYINRQKKIQQRASTLLKDVHYVIEAHFEMTNNANESDNVGKYCDIFRRRLEKGQAYSQPYLGCREFPACFAAWKDPVIPAVNFSKDLGLMLYDFDYSDSNGIQPTYFHARLENGVLQVAGERILR